MSRKSFLSTLEIARLEHACSVVATAFGHRPYLVGSSTETRDFRDVDLRLILPDDEFDYLFGPDVPNEAWQLTARGNFPGGLWGLVCMTIAQYLTDASGLPIDFQIQRQSDANEKYPGSRNPMGHGFRHFAGGGDATEVCEGVDGSAQRSHDRSRGSDGTAVTSTPSPAAHVPVPEPSEGEK